MNNKLSLKEKVGYGLGDMASNFYMGFFGLFLLYYYTDVFGISPAAAGTMLLVTKVLDAISDPAMGLISDRTNSRWGRYRPYLLWGAIPYALLGYLLFLGPDLSENGKLVFAYISYSLVMLAYTAINVPYSALLAVIHPDAEERTKATQYRFIFASLGTLAVGAFATPLVKWLGGENELLGFKLAILLFAVLSVALLWVTFATTRERIQAKPHTSSIKQDLDALFSNVSWIVLLIAGMLVVVGLVARFASIIFYSKYYLNDDGSTIFYIFDTTAIITSLGLLGQLIGALVTPSLARRFEKRHLVAAMNFMHATLLILCYFLPSEHFWLIVFVHSLGVFTFGITITLLFSMYTDCAQYSEWKTGKQTAGLVVSASMFSLKFGSSVGGALPGFVLAIFGFVANQIQTEQAIKGILIMFNFLPATFFLIAGLVILFYRIDRNLLLKAERELFERQ